jgi:hypothetical protein
MLNVVNRILFQNYKFLFNFTLIFLQQFVSLILFRLGTNNKNFKNKVGELSFEDFKKYKFYYLSFSLIFIANTFFNFYGNQLVKNISMFLSLKKLTLVMLFFIDFFYGKKKLSCITITCIFLVTGGSILVGIDSFSNDYFGYIVVFFNNVTAISYSKFTEVFRKHTGITNLKLLVYNNYLAMPILTIAIISTGEAKRLYIYFTCENNGSEGTYYGLMLFLFISCLFCAILTSSFFISNEKNSSLMTNLLTNTKTIFTSVTLYLFDKAKNKLSIPIFIGLIMSTLGAIFINAESLFNNLSFSFLVLFFLIDILLNKDSALIKIAPTVDIISPAKIKRLNLFFDLSKKYIITLIKTVLVFVNKFVIKEEVFSLLIKKLDNNIAQHKQLIIK